MGQISAQERHLRLAMARLSHDFRALSRRTGTTLAQTARARRAAARAYTLLADDVGGARGDYFRDRSRQLHALADRAARFAEREFQVADGQTNTIVEA